MDGRSPPSCRWCSVSSSASSWPNCGTSSSARREEGDWMNALDDLGLGVAVPPGHRELAHPSWRRLGHSMATTALTGRSPLAGKIESPQVQWSLALSGRELLVEVTPSADNQAVLLSATAAAKAASPEWSPAGPVPRDIDGRGVQPAVETFHERWAKILPDVAGLQRVAWNYTWTDQKVCRLQLFAYDGGWDQPRLVWETDPPEDTVFNPLNVVYDIDGDGVVEVCVAAATTV